LTIGLGSLCACWIAARLFALPVRFDMSEQPVVAFNLEALIDLNLVFWPIVCLIFIFGALSLFRKKLKGNYFVVFWILLTVISIVMIYVAIFLIESNVGNVPEIIPYEGNALIFEELYAAFSWAGFLVLMYSLEINYHKKTRYIFTLLSCLSLVFTLYSFGTGQGMAAEVILFIISMAGLLAIWYFMTVSTFGKLRRRLLSLTLGHICMVFTFLLDTPLGKFMLASTPEDYIFVLPPSLLILGLILYFIGVLPLAFEWQSVYNINRSSLQHQIK
ncbi:MAG TPA: hypothetical protein VKK79_07525, partial [Candidatus Lokiarchaeia archaeon]|nr:hypothetical protein [Candidatus Lokiarchaeia archaeon]